MWKLPHQEGNLCPKGQRETPLNNKVNRTTPALCMSLHTQHTDWCAERPPTTWLKPELPD